MARYRLRPGPRVNYDERSHDDDDDDDDDDCGAIEGCVVEGQQQQRVVTRKRVVVGSLKPGSSPSRRRGLRERKRPAAAAVVVEDDGDDDEDDELNAKSYPKANPTLSGVGSGNDGDRYPFLKSLLLTNREAAADSILVVDPAAAADDNIDTSGEEEEDAEDAADELPDYVAALPPPPPLPLHSDELNRLLFPPSDHDRHSNNGALSVVVGGDGDLTLSPPPSLIRRSASYVAASAPEPVANDGAAAVAAVAQGFSTRSSSKIASTAKKEEGSGKRRHCGRRRAGERPEVDAVRRTSERLVHKRMKFPFAALPPECQSHILSMLPAKERLRAGLVCRSWRSLASAPSIWTSLDLTQFKVDDDMLTNHCKCFRKCKHLEAFELYQKEICKYVDHLSRSVRPLVKELKFAFDFGHPVDAWDSVVIRLLSEAKHLNALTSVAAKWDSTPNRPGCLTRYCCLVGQIRTAVHRHIQRIHLFRSFLNLLSKKARHLEHFRAPFDWSVTNVMYMTRFARLTHLTLDHYQTFEQLAPWKIDCLLQSFKQLQYLKITYVSPSFKHTQLYSFDSSSLRHLDISGCVGVFLRELSAPNLESLHLARHPWQGTLKEVEEERAKIPCLKQVIREAPALRIVNSLRLFADSPSGGGEGSAAAAARTLQTPTSSVRLRSAAAAAATNNAHHHHRRNRPPSSDSSSGNSSSLRCPGRGALENLLFKICPCSHHGRSWKGISAAD